MAQPTASQMLDHLTLLESQVHRDPIGVMKALAEIMPGYPNPFSTPHPGLYPNPSGNSTSGATQPAPPSASSSPAIQACMNAYHAAYQAALAQNKLIFQIDEAAGKAYGCAMPPLSGRGNIRDFIACVTHGMILEAIPWVNGTKLLYAAQIAYTSTTHAKRVKKSTKSTPKPTTFLPDHSAQPVDSK